MATRFSDSGMRSIIWLNLLSRYLVVTSVRYNRQAVVEGFWVVFEDIDKAPPDILSIILPLLEGAIKFSTGHGEV